MSAGDTSPVREADVGVRLAGCVADIVELAALRGRAHDLGQMVGGRGLQLPAFGRSAVSGGALALCVRPDRWLLLVPRASPGQIAEIWQQACAELGAAIDMSCGLSAFHVMGPAAREMLARGCRVDLDPGVFPRHHAAATIMAQVAVILTALPAGMLLLTPSSTARHFHEWLVSTGKPFGLMLQPDVTVAALCAEELP